MITPEGLRSELAEALGHPMGELHAVAGGMDAAAACFSSERYFIKVRSDVPPGARAAMELNLPHVLGPQRIVKLRSGDSALIYSAIEGHDGFESPLTLPQWTQVGVVLRQVHDYAGELLELPRESFRIEGVEQIWDSPLSHLVEANRKKMEWIVQEVQTLGRELADQDWSLVPCHADLHVGNILTSQQGLWIVDWDSARLAPRECDLVFFHDGGILELHCDAEESAFLEGYGEISWSPKVIRYYRLARVLEDLVSFAREGNEPWFLKQFAAKVFRDPADS